MQSPLASRWQRNLPLVVEEERPLLILISTKNKRPSGGGGGMSSAKASNSFNNAVDAAKESLVDDWFLRITLSCFALANCGCLE